MESIFFNAIVSLIGISTAWMGISSVFPPR